MHSDFAHGEGFLLRKLPGGGGAGGGGLCVGGWGGGWGGKFGVEGGVNMPILQTDFPPSPQRSEQFEFSSFHISSSLSASVDWSDYDELDTDRNCCHRPIYQAPITNPVCDLKC